MVREFKAKLKDGELQVDAIVETNGNDVTVHVPSMKLIEKLKRKEGVKNDYGIRRIQSV
jgi:hypothetical protein|tara:strand:+ start:3798 stop:3974 length:177 start_codon:yes stop_codon:yes gene_type:complete